MSFWRVCLLVGLMVLLPWRSALADRMALANPMAPVQAPVPSDTHLDAHMAALTAQAAPCPHHGLSDPPTAMPEHEAQQPGTGEHTHAVCDACNGPAMAHPQTTVLLPRPAPARWQPAVETFASVHPNREHKPPIRA